MSKVIAEKLFPKSYHILPCTPIYISIYYMCIFFLYTCSGYTSLLSGVVSLLDFAGVESPHRSCDSPLYHGNPSCLEAIRSPCPSMRRVGITFQNLHPLKLTCPQKRGLFSINKCIFQPSMFGGHVMFFPGVWLKGAFLFSKLSALLRSLTPSRHEE